MLEEGVDGVEEARPPTVIKRNSATDNLGLRQKEMTIEDQLTDDVTQPSAVATAL